MAGGLVRCALALAAGLHGGCTTIEGPANDPVRELGIATVERLGRAIYEQDRLASRATDVLFDRYAECFTRRASRDG